MKDVEFLSGKKVYLRGLHEEDLSGPLLYWTDDPEVTRYMFRGWRPANADEVIAAYKNSIASDNNIEMAICSKETEQIVGIAGLYDADWKISRQAEFRIMIGEKSAWGKGYGLETTNLVVAYGFDKLNLNRIWLGHNAADERAGACYAKAGFVKEGVLREASYRNGQYYDIVRMSILHREFKK